jgi:hypothetical protein
VSGLAGGRYGCPLCNEPPPHEHDLGTILNARYYCPDGTEHQWGPPSRWFKRVRCTRCGYRQPRSDRPAARQAEMDAFIRKHGGARA